MSPYNRGKADFARGLALAANPFPQRMAGHFKAWNEGWLDAFTRLESYLRASNQ